MPSEIVDCDGKGFLIKEDERDVNIPYWQLLHNHLTEYLKEGKFIKHTHRHNLITLNGLIKKGKHLCDDCGNEMNLELPTTYEQLLDIILQFTNNQYYFVCDDCHIKSIKEGRIIGDKDEWYPDKEKLLKEALEKHGTI